MAVRMLISLVAWSLLLFSARGTEGADNGRERETGRTYYRLGHEYYRERKYKEALDQLHKAAKYAPHDPDIIHATGVVLFSMGRYDEAGDHFARVLDIESAGDDVREGAREGILLIAQLEKAKRKKIIAHISLYALLALAAACVFIIVRQFTRFFRLNRSK